MERFSVRPNDPDRPIRLLSGGNQQKVLLGRWLATNPDLLLLDEPTRGIDVGAKADIQETVTELAEAGMSVVFISSELEEVVRLSERIVILKDHEKVGEVINGPDVTAERIVSIIAAESEEEAELQAEALAEEVIACDTRKLMKETRHDLGKTLVRTPWFWGLVGIPLLLIVNTVKDPTYLRSPSTRPPVCSPATCSTSCACRRRS